MKRAQKGMESQGNPVTHMESKTVLQLTSLTLFILGIPILLAFASTAVQYWGLVFDDAFISYRYAQNLAMGHGITWNPGQPPTEGYTNLLLVLILAPAIWAGLDPLLVTRILSFICVIAISGILFTVSRRQYNCSVTTALMIAAIIFLVPATKLLCLLGLETVIYGFFLLVTFIAGVTFVVRQQISYSILFSCLLFLTMLLRPEAALLYPIIFVASVVVAIRSNVTLKPLVLGLLTLLALGGAYLTWKHFYFGQLLPNPFYLKASGQSLISPDGLDSFRTFINDYPLLLILVFLSLALGFFSNTPEQAWKKIAVISGFIFLAVYCLFFAHIDTLMDVYGRFLYPLVPLLILLATPTLAKITGYIESISAPKIFVLPCLTIVFLLTFGPSNIFKINEHIRNLTPNDNMQTSQSLMQKEYRVAKVLARFPQIKEVRIAFGDSGVIPYFTGAIWLDVVGLNDGFIAKTRDKNKLVDYFFNWSPDLVIHPGKIGYSWLQSGHGPLGDTLSWSNDPRWDEYEYVGTSTIQDSIYDLQYFVKKSSRFRAPLEGFLKAYVVDGWYDPFPLPIGTYHPK